MAGEFGRIWNEAVLATLRYTYCLDAANDIMVVEQSN
jgi:hypothetical protein